jgi:predicted amino acid dehydrogenase
VTAAERARREQVRWAAEQLAPGPEGGTVTTAVIGATGRVGSQIVRGVLARGEAVTALVRARNARYSLDCNADTAIFPL